MRSAIRVTGTFIVLITVWAFRNRRAGLLIGMLVGIWLQRRWVTGPVRAGTLGRPSGPPRWVRAADGRVIASGALGAGPRRHTGSPFGAGPAKPKRHW
jgi:hypothetical protein